MSSQTPGQPEGEQTPNEPPAPSSESPTPPPAPETPPAPAGPQDTQIIDASAQPPVDPSVGTGNYGYSYQPGYPAGNAAAAPAYEPGYEPQGYTPPPAPAQPTYGYDQAQQPPTYEQTYAQSGQPQPSYDPNAYDPNAYYQQTYAQDTGVVPGLTAGGYDGGGYGGGTQGAAAAGAGGGGLSGFANRTLIVAVVVALVVGLFAGVVGVVVGSSISGGGPIAGTGQFNPGNPDTLSPRADNSVASIAQKVLPSTATIIARNGQQGGTGSGFVISNDGYIMTNNHVISGVVGGGTLQVQFPNQDPIAARLVGRSVSYDIAVIKVDQGNLTPATLGNSDSVQIGDAAVAIGSPLGLEGTVTSGIISALRRPVTAGGQGESSYISALQTDAPINPGNSGGPLVNAEGQVIGVNSAIATLGGSANGGTGGSIGLGFAIPINNAKRIADEIIATGKSAVPVIGVQVNMQYEGPGAQVSKVDAGGPAAKAGLQDGDIITQVNGDQVSGPTELLSAIRSFAPGQTIKLTVTGPNGGNPHEVDVTLGSRDE